MDSLTTKQGVSNSRRIDNNQFIGTFPSSLLASFGIFSPFYERFEDES